MIEEFLNPELEKLRSLKSILHYLFWINNSGKETVIRFQ